MADALIALGSNLGERAVLLSEAATRLEQHPQVDAFKLSTLLETQPIGGPGEQGVFLNACAKMQTSLSASDLLELLLETEQQLGRTRQQLWEARHIDLDLLLYDDTILKSPPLEIPHPRMAVRRFVLEPAAEVAADMVHPVFGWTIAELWEHLQHAPPLFCVQSKSESAADKLLADVGKILNDKLKHKVLSIDGPNSKTKDNPDNALQAGNTVLMGCVQPPTKAVKLLAVTADVAKNVCELPPPEGKTPYPFILLSADEKRAAIEFAAAIEAMR